MQVRELKMDLGIYSNCVRGAKNFTIDEKLLSSYIEKIPDLPQEHRNAIALIIMHHFYSEHPEAKCKGIPYGGRIPTGKKGLIITEELPESLLKILGYYFVNKVFN